MKLAEFISSNYEAILQEWEQFARSSNLKNRNLGKKILRDHTEQLLKDIADDFDTPQTKHEQEEKSKGHNLESALTSAAVKHGLERFQLDFGITDIIAEYRFIRAAVILLWNEQNSSESIDRNDLICFNEVLDQQIFEAAGSFQIEREKQVRQFDTVRGDQCFAGHVL